MERSGQPPCDPQMPMKQIQVFDADSLTMGTKHLSVLASQPDPSVGQVQVPYQALRPTADAGGLLSAQMTHRLEALVRSKIDNRF